MNSSTNRIAFIHACWHKDIVDRCKDSFIKQISENANGPGTEVEVFEVAGAFEIPLHAKVLARSGKYDAIVAAGFIIDGGIYRHEYVAQAVISGLMQVQLETNTPVFSVVLTPHHFHNNEDHAQFYHEHFVKKGVEVANACTDTVLKLKALG